MTEDIKTVMILTWVSGSWKTTLQDKLIKEFWFTRPINYTTRLPRDKKSLDEILDIRNTKSNLPDDAKENTTEFNLIWTEGKELDEYIFVTEDVFLRKLRNWDFAEHTYYNWNFYWVWRFIDYSKQNCVILEPVWVASMVKYFSELWVPYKTFYLKITPDTQEERLWVKRRESYAEVEKRKKDFLYFEKFDYDVVLNWEIDERLQDELIQDIFYELDLDYNEFIRERNKAERFGWLI